MSQNFEPIQVLEIELSEPLKDILPKQREDGHDYKRGRALVRLFGQSLGTVDFQYRAIGLAATEVAHTIWNALSAEINLCLSQNNLPHIHSLNVWGIRSVSTPQCVKDREQFLKKAPFATVVIATRNRPDLISSCLNGLLKLNYPHYEIVVVDNNPSNNATAEVVKRDFGHVPNIRYVREDRPGLSWARDCGLAQAKGEITVFTDDDVVVDKNWLLEIAKAFTATDNVGCVTGVFVARELETEAQVWFEEYGGWHKRFHRRIFDLKKHHTGNQFFPYNAWVCGSGANIAFKTEVLRDIGGFATELSTGTPAMAGEEAFSFFSTLTRGYTIVHEPSAIVHHTHRRDYAGFKRQVYGYGTSTTAYLTKVLVSKPSRIFDFMWLALPGIKNLFKNHVKNQASVNHAPVDKSVSSLLRYEATYPDELMQIERRGKLYGPLAYFKSVLNDRKVRREFAARNREQTPPSPNIAVA